MSWYLHLVGRYNEANNLARKTTHVRANFLGQEHPDTLTSTANLASTYMDQRRWKEAEDLGVKVMEVRKGVLGQDRPDALNSMANLASTYWNQGRCKETELFVEVMGMGKWVFGQEHQIP